MSDAPLIDYRALRLLMGLIAFFLPIIVWLRSGVELTSISASYHTDARDWFVGMLFVVSAFLSAYNGRPTPHIVWTLIMPSQKMLSKVASIAALCVALFPTNKYGTPANLSSEIHGAATGILFFILAYFCFHPFIVKAERGWNRKYIRNGIIKMCGWTMVFSMASLFVDRYIPVNIPDSVPLVFLAEWIALGAFGISWLLAAKWSGVWFLVDAETESAFYIFGHKEQA